MTARAAEPLGRTSAPRPAWSGLLPIDKPVGVTSHDVVDRARRRLRIRTIGHLGTLDPGASGLLVLAIGAATRCATVWQGGEKCYDATIRFGITTDTQDLQGRELTRSDLRPSEGEVREASSRLTGDLAQVPPMVSALKHEGRRLYDLARRGIEVERAPRPVRVASWEWLAIGRDEARVRIRCSGGTYVRTLAHDLGQRLGCGAALAALRRLASEPWTLEGACAWRDLDDVPAETLLERRGVPLDRALETLPGVRLGHDAAEAVGRGRAVAVEAPGAPRDAGPRSVVLRDAGGVAIALGELRGESPVMAHPSVVFPWAVREGREP